jgi:hypothetical protein
MEMARDETNRFLAEFMIPLDLENRKEVHRVLTATAQTSLRTKVRLQLADHLTNAVVEAVRICGYFFPLFLFENEAIRYVFTTIFS